MTTNAGTLGAKAKAGFGEPETGGEAQKREEREREARERIKDAFSPELMGRIDAVVPFQPLSEATLTRIAALRLREALARVEAAGLRVEPDPSLPTLLAKQCARDPAGARALRRLIETTLLDPAADLLLQGATRASLTPEGLRATASV